MKNELDLILAAQAGSQKAFAIIFENYRRIFLKVISKKLKGTDLESEAEDILLEAFAKSFIKINTFKPEFTFGTWLGTICNNHMIDAIRKRKLDTISLDQKGIDSEEETFQIEITSEDKDPLQDMLHGQMKDITIEAIGELSWNLRVLMGMRYVRELSYKEISEEMDMPVGTVKARLFRGREKMKELLEKSNVSREIYQS